MANWFFEEANNFSMDMDMDWNGESYPKWQDFKAFLFFASFFPLTRFILDRFIFEKIGKLLIFGKASMKVKNVRHRKKMEKFKESAWKFLYSVSAELFALFVTYNEPWFTNTKYFWRGPQDQVWPHLKIKLKMKLLYMYCGGFYIYAIFALIFWETRRSDFKALMAHHFSTVALIVPSYMARLTRVGSMVLALHEGSDIFLEFAKMSKYSGFQLLSSIFFSLFALSWFVLRLGFFPFWLIRNLSYETFFMLGKEDSNNLKGMMHYYYCALFLNILLFSLLPLHLYWSWKILTMLINQIRAKGQIGNDVRSDPEDEDDKEHEN